MHDCMQYDLIQCQGRDLDIGSGHTAFKVGNSAIFKCYIIRHLQWELATDH